MRYLFKSAFAASLVLGACSPVLSQTGGGVGRGSAHPSQTGNQGQPAGQGQGVRGGNAQHRFGGINQTPWFADANVRRDLRLTDDQFNRLNTVYGQHWTTYNTGLSQLGSLEEQARLQRMQGLQSAFNTNLGTASNDFFQGDQRTRFNQVWMQYRGYDVFNDPTIQQRLNLTPQQLEQLRRLDQEYATQINEVYQGLGNDRVGALRRFSDLRGGINTRVNTILKNEQRPLWRDMLGEPYSFQLPTNGASNQPGGNIRP